MGALTSNRKRTDECFNLLSPSPSFNVKNYFNYSNPIDTRISKKPKISLSPLIEAHQKVNFLTSHSTVSRLNRYPEPQQLRREVHAPCRVLKFSSRLSSCSRSRASGSSERAERMGLSWSILKFKYEQVKEQAFGSFKHVKKPDKEQDVLLEDSSDVEIIEDGNEVRSVVSDEHRMQEPDGFLLVLENEKLEEKARENGVILASSSVASDLTNAENAEKMFDSLSLDRERYSGCAYKKIKEYVDSIHASKLRTLQLEIDLNVAKRNSVQSFNATKKLDEAKKPVEPFASLTEEDEENVTRAFSNSNRRKILAMHKNSGIEITGEVLQCLRPGAWLNDEVINVYLELLKERERRDPKQFLNCHFFNTFFYNKLLGGRNGYDYKSVRRWTTQKKLGYGLIDCDKIFVPIHKEVHWCLAVINNKDKKFQYLNSLGGIDSKVLKVLARYFVDEVKDKSGQNIDISSWECDYVEDLPEQRNGFDCGVFMIKYADFYSRGMELCFSQESMPYFRLRTAKEILSPRAD